jgi:choice-of-anchor B domain-containing protein
MTRFLLAVLLLAGAGAPASAAAQVGFGTSATVHDGQVLVGEPGHELRPGAVYVFEPGSGGWSVAQTLEAPDGEPGNRFGIRSVAADDLLLVSATRADDGTGAVYVFRRDGGTWSPDGRLVVEGRSPADSLGTGLAVDGDWIVLGSIAHDEGRGAAWVFKRDGDAWVEHQMLAPPDLEAEDRFGTRVALSGDWLLVSAPEKDDRAGAVYAYRYDAAGDTWEDLGRVAPELAQPGARLGTSMALRDGQALIGAPAFLNVGAVAHFAVGESGEGFGLQTLLLPFQATPGAAFGSDLSLAGDELLVGAPGSGLRGEGRSFAYRWDAGSGTWAGATSFTADDLGGGDAFGATLGAGDDLAVVSALGQDFGAGAAYVFRREGGEWTGQERLVSDLVTADAILGDEVRCSDEGEAALFECSEVDLLSFLPVSDMGANRGVRTNDVWGWTDPETGREIVIVGMTDQASFVDVSNPYEPIYLGRLPKPEEARPSVWRDMKVYDNHVFVVSDGSGDHGMQVFDLTRLRELDGSNPPTFEPDFHYTNVASAHNVVVNEESGYAYIVGASGGGTTCGGGLHMVDVREPTNPTFAGCFSDTSTGRARTGYSHDAQCVMYRGPDPDYEGAEICLGSNETALSIADVTDKENPEAVSMATYPNVGYSHQGWLTEDHRYFYMNDELDETGGLTPTTRTMIWDLTDLDDPILVKEHFSESRATDHNLYVRGDLMYQSNYASGLRVLDVSDPENPEQVGYFDTVPYGGDTNQMIGSWSNYPYFESGIVVVTSGREGLFLVRYRDTNLIP